MVDAGPLYAAADRRDARHVDCRRALELAARPLLVPQLVVGEVAYFVGTYLGVKAEARFLGSFVAGDLIAEPVATRDWIRMVELVWQYHDLPLGTVDASIVAAAERLAIGRILTLDRRHFAVVRPRHVEAFELSPA